MPPSVRMSTLVAAPGVAALLCLVGAVPAAAREARDGLGPKVQLRRPVALATAGEWLLVGNRRSGTICVVDPAAGSVLAEHAVARRISDMATLVEDRHLLVLDDAQGRLLRVSLDAREVSVRSVANLPPAAARLVVARDRRGVFVTARWSREVVSLTLDRDLERPTREESIALPFAPHDMLLVDGGRTLLVADAFGGQLALIDATGSALLAVRELDGHNIRGLAISPDGKRLYIAHQQIHDGALADYEELHWGRMVRNVVRVLDVGDVLDAGTGRTLGGWLDEQGGIGGATGDPAAVVAAPRGLTAVAFSGVGEVVVRQNNRESRIAVGARPGAMLVLGERLYVANRFDDSVSVIDLRRAMPAGTISLGPTPDLTATERGERLFFDATISHDGWMSCHSCHTDGHSSGLLVDTLGDGDRGAPKRVPSLLGTRDTGPWGWTASADSLAVQVRSSVTTTLHGAPLTDSRRADLVTFLESLEVPPSPGTGKPGEVARGRDLFGSLGCADCHTPPVFTSGATYDVGLADEKGRRRFNPPSLRGVGHRDRLFHDGRARSLNDVLVRYRHQLDSPISSRDLADLTEFLRSL